MRRSIFLICLFCSACVFNDEYPVDWPAMVVDSEECPDISGTYEDLGLSVSSDGNHRLSHLFLSEPLQAVDVRVTISQPDGQTLRVEALGADASEQAYRLLRDGSEYSCQEGRIWISDTDLEIEPIGSLPPAVGVGRWRMGLAKALDGSLVGEERSTVVGVALVIVPFGLSGETYFLWRLAEPPRETS